MLSNYRTLNVMCWTFGFFHRQWVKFLLLNCSARKYGADIQFWILLLMTTVLQAPLQAFCARDIGDTPHLLHPDAFIASSFPIDRGNMVMGYTENFIPFLFKFISRLNCKAEWISLHLYELTGQRCGLFKNWNIKAKDL